MLSVSKLMANSSKAVASGGEAKSTPASASKSKILTGVHALVNLGTLLENGKKAVDSAKETFTDWQETISDAQKLAKRVGAYVQSYTDLKQHNPDSVNSHIQEIQVEINHILKLINKIQTDPSEAATIEAIIELFSRMTQFFNKVQNSGIKEKINHMLATLLIDDRKLTEEQRQQLIKLKSKNINIHEDIPQIIENKYKALSTFIMEKVKEKFNLDLSSDLDDLSKYPIDKISQLSDAEKEIAIVLLQELNAKLCNLMVFIDSFCIQNGFDKESILTEKIQLLGNHSLSEILKKHDAIYRKLLREANYRDENELYPYTKSANKARINRVKELNQQITKYENDAKEKLSVSKQIIKSIIGNEKTRYTTKAKDALIKKYKDQFNEINEWEKLSDKDLHKEFISYAKKMNKKTDGCLSKEFYESIEKLVKELEKIYQQKNNNQSSLKNERFLLEKDLLSLEADQLKDLGLDDVDIQILHDGHNESQSREYSRSSAPSVSEFKSPTRSSHDVRRPSVSSVAGDSKSRVQSPSVASTPVIPMDEKARVASSIEIKVHESDSKSPVRKESKSESPKNERVLRYYPRMGIGSLITEFKDNTIPAIQDILNRAIEVIPSISKDTDGNVQYKFPKHLQTNNSRNFAPATHRLTRNLTTLINHYVAVTHNPFTQRGIFDNAVFAHLNSERIAEIIDDIKTLLPSNITLISNEVLELLKLVNALIKQLYLFSDKVEIHYYLKESCLTNQALHNFGQQLHATLSKAGYEFEAENQFPYSKAIDDQREKMLNQPKYDEITKSHIKKLRKQSPVVPQPKKSTCEIRKKLLSKVDQRILALKELRTSFHTTKSRILLENKIDALSKLRKIMQQKGHYILDSFQILQDKYIDYKGQKNLLGQTLINEENDLMQELYKIEMDGTGPLLFIREKKIIQSPAPKVDITHTIMEYIEGDIDTKTQVREELSQRLPEETNKDKIQDIILGYCEDKATDSKSSALVEAKQTTAAKGAADSKYGSPTPPAESKYARAAAIPKSSAAAAAPSAIELAPLKPASPDVKPPAAAALSPKPKTVKFESSNVSELVMKSIFNESISQKFKLQQYQTKLIEDRIDELNKNWFDTETKREKNRILTKLKTSITEGKTLGSSISKIKREDNNYHLLFEGKTGYVMKQLEFCQSSREKMLKLIDLHIQTLTEQYNEKFYFFEGYRKAKLWTRVLALISLSTYIKNETQFDNIQSIVNKLPAEQREALIDNESKLLADLGTWFRGVKAVNAGDTSLHAFEKLHDVFKDPQAHIASPIVRAAKAG